MWFLPALIRRASNTVRNKITGKVLDHAVSKIPAPVTPTTKGKYNENSKSGSKETSGNPDSK